MSVINTNVKALVAQESMRSNNLKLSTAMERLSTGLRINSAKDDAAGLAITNRMSSQIRGLSMAVKNANDAISMAQTADGAYGQVTSMLQRMRELAVQASNGAMSGSDRGSIQLEIDELKAEIENVAQKTSFNGIKLLDGSAKDLTMQTGANQGDTIGIGFDSVKTTDIGSGLRPGLTSVGGDNDTFGQVSSGTLMINGVSVGTTLASDDTVSSAGNASSSIAKAAAINKVSDQSGVYARVNATHVQGITSATMSGTATSGTVTINGVSTSTITTGTDTEINRALITNAINAISGQTGVRAINTGSDTGGIELIADDGRNIVYQTSTLSSTISGLNAAALATAITAVGTYSLYSSSGSDIKIEAAAGASAAIFAATGLKIGTFEADQAQVVTTNRAGVAYGTAPKTLDDDDLVINGISISKALETDDTSSYDVATAVGSDKAASAIAIAAAINKKTDLTGVTAKADANVLRGTGFTANAGSSGIVLLNGVQVTVSGNDLEDVIESFNEVAGQTGVVARRYGEGLELRAEDGRNIAIAELSANPSLSVASLGLTGLTELVAADTISATTYYASVSLSSETAFTVKEGSATDSDFEDLGFRAGTFGGENTGIKIAEVDVTTQESAAQAITAIDSAIDDVAAAQARSGAYQNRLDSIVSVLSESIENQSASRSRILDTDYATETTALAKAQIVQQAATAMLAQANQSAQSVLALLQ